MQTIGINDMARSVFQRAYVRRYTLGAWLGVPVVLSYSFYKLFVENIFTAEEEFVNRDAVDFAPNDSHIGDAAPGHSPAWLLRFQNHIFKTRFGKWFFLPIPVKTGMRDLVRHAALTCRATFYPIGHVEPENMVTDYKPDLSSSLKSTKRTDSWLPTTIDDYTTAYKSGKFTPVDVIEKLLQDLEILNGKLHMMCEYFPDQIRAQAQESAARYAEGKPLGPFDGVPIAMKDQLDIEGHRRRNGLEFCEGGAAVEDCTITARCRAQGMIIVGLTNMHPKGLSCFGSNISSDHGICRNPYNDQFFCGASSSGAGAVVASGIMPLAIGTDGGGSVRIPSGYCNLVGLFPSIGRIPQRGTSSGTCSAAGPMAHTPQDCARLYAVIAGPDFQEGSEQSRIQPAVTIPKTILKSLTGLRVGIDQDWNQHGVEKVLLQDFQRRLNWMIDQGAEIVNFIMPEKDLVYAAHLICFSNEIASDVVRYAQEGKKVDYDVELVSNIQAMSTKATDYYIANKIRTKFMRIFENDIWPKMDIIATPMARTTMVRIGEQDHIYGRADPKTVGKISHFTRIFNFVGCPGIMVQLGHDKNNIPYGFHMAAKWWDEKRLFEIADFMESQAPYKKPAHLSTPPFKQE